MDINEVCNYHMRHFLVLCIVSEIHMNIQCCVSNVISFAALWDTFWYCVYLVKYIRIFSVVCLMWFHLQHYFCTCSKWKVKAIKIVSHRHCIWYFQLKYISCCCCVLKQVLLPTVKLGMDQYLVVCCLLIIGILMWCVLWINTKCVFLL
jgi:hypothetical protein